MRWEEEIVLLKEEMRRYDAFMTWHANWWRERAAIRSQVDGALAEGLAAYAFRQASLREALRDRANYLWRKCDGWDLEESVPMGRTWFEKEIQPKCAPPNAFSGAYRPVYVKEETASFGEESEESEEEADEAEDGYSDTYSDGFTDGMADDEDQGASSDAFTDATGEEEDE
jgi:hypothetical protein